jgi:predicted secreted Zn-dependent protease
MNNISKLLLFCLLIISQASNAVVKETLDYSYYTAQGNPSVSLRAILNAVSPIRENGKSFHGYTKWYVKWHFWWFEKPDGRCKITKVDTRLTATITLPDLVGAESVQQNQFDTFISALKVHELGHYDIGKQVATLIDEKIQALPEMSSCKVLESTANDIGYQILDEYKAIEQQYDVSTNHGKTQGAWLE